MIFSRDFVVSSKFPQCPLVLLLVPLIKTDPYADLEDSCPLQSVSTDIYCTYMTHDMTHGLYVFAFYLYLVKGT
jgi:hypothetical protein